VNLSYSPLLTDAFSPTPAPVAKSTAGRWSPQTPAATPQRPARDAAAARTITRTGSLLLWLPAWNILSARIREGSVW